MLLRELGEYQPDLLDRPRLVVGSKCDVAQFDSEEMVVSAVTHVGIDKMVGKLAELVRQDRTEAVIETQPVIHRPLGDGFEVLATGERKWEIEGRTALRAVRVTDISNPEALDYVQERLKSLGIDRALSQAGVRAGALVRIGDLEFEYEDEL